MNAVIQQVMGIAGRRKYTLTLISLLAVIALTSFSLLDGTQFLTGIGMVLGVHAAGNVTDKKLNGSAGNG